MNRHRPREDDSVVIEEAASQCLACLEPWLEDHNQSFDSDKIKRDVLDVLARHCDGYSMAKYLENSAGWRDVDAQLVNILHGSLEARDAALQPHEPGYGKLD